MNPTFTEAQKWLDRGIAVVPTLPHSKQPVIKWKRYQNELPNLVDLVRWFYRPGYNLAIICGWQNLVIVDFDDVVKYAKFIYDYPEYKNTYSVKSTRGKHLFFFCDDPPRQKGLGDNVDIKSTGYCLTYPSIHPSGSIYQIENDKPIMRIDELPLSPSTGGGVCTYPYCYPPLY